MVDYGILFSNKAVKNGVTDELLVETVVSMVTLVSNGYNIHISLWNAFGSSSIQTFMFYLW